MSSPRLLLTFAAQTLTVRFALFSTFFALMFFSLTMFLLNILNFISLGTAPYPILSKLRILSILFIGSFQTVSGLDLILLVTISALFGFNLALILKKLNFLRYQSNLQITLGAGIVSLAAAGCASCGLSIVSLVGLGSALAVLPFGGVELYVAAITLLSFSLLYNLRALYRVCKF